MKQIFLFFFCIILAAPVVAKDKTKEFKGKTVTFQYPSFLKLTKQEESDSLTSISFKSEDGSKADVKLIIPSKGYTVDEYAKFFTQNMLSYFFQSVGYGNFNMTKLDKDSLKAYIGTTPADGYEFNAQFAGIPLFADIYTANMDKKHFAVVSVCSKDSVLMQELKNMTATIKFEGIAPQEEAEPAAEPVTTPAKPAETTTAKPENTTAPAGEKVFDVVEQMPTFPGGNGELMKWLGANVHYPDSAYARGTQGRVIVEFVVEKDGSIGGVSVVRSVDPELDEEAMRAVKTMPAWTPGMQGGKAVRVKYHVPISFKMPEVAKQPDARIIGLANSITDGYEISALGEIDENPLTPASFVGGEEALNEYIATNLYYPPNLRNFGIEDDVTIEFVVEKDGQLNNIVVTKYKSETLAKQALKMVQGMPNWTPATDKNEQPVRSKGSLNVEFKK